MSSVLAFGGGAAVGRVTQREADRLLIDSPQNTASTILTSLRPTATPSYVLDRGSRGTPKEVFLGCKTTARDKAAAWESMKRSLERLKVDRFDLFQFHGVDDLETLHVIVGPGGALEAVLEAKKQGLLSFVGITGHRPYTHVEALNLFDFDTVLFPLSRVHAAHSNDFNNFVPLLAAAARKMSALSALRRSQSVPGAKQCARTRPGTSPSTRSPRSTRVSGTR